MPIAEGVLTALIGAAGAAGAAGLNAASTAIANRKSYKWSKEFFDYQNQYNLKNYSPAANMERLRAAGINPHEVSGTPGSGMSISGGIDTPKYQSPLAGAPEAMNNALQLALNAYQVKKNTQNQTDLVQSQIAKNNADAARTNYQVQNLMPVELEYQKNRTKIPLYQLGTMKLQQQKMLNEISLFSMQKQKYQLGLDLMEIEKEFAREYNRWRNESVKWQSKSHKAQAGISGLDLKNYQAFGLRPQDPYYMRIAGNVTDRVAHSNTRFGRWLNKLIYGD